MTGSDSWIRAIHVLMWLEDCLPGCRILHYAIAAYGFTAALDLLATECVLCAVIEACNSLFQFALKTALIVGVALAAKPKYIAAKAAPASCGIIIVSNKNWSYLFRWCHLDIAEHTRPF